MKKIPITELFGPTIQGEGIMTGQVTHFLRTGGCPLRCTWCDSMHSVDPEQVKANANYMESHEIINAIAQMPKVPWITLTGGDPCMHKGLGDIIRTLQVQHKYKIAVETQGTLFPDWLVQCDAVTFSPKPPSSGNVVEFEELSKFIIENHRNVEMCLKIVVASADDLEYAYEWARLIPDGMVSGFWINSATHVWADSPSYHSPSIRALDLLNRYSNLTDVVLKDIREGKNVGQQSNLRVGCQQHCLLWPDKLTGV